MKYFSQALPASIAMLVVTSASLTTPVSVLAASCDGPAPAAPAKVWATSGPGAGQITVGWSESNSADRYALAYGTSSNSYMYGAHNAGGQGARSYTVGMLKPGQKYFFRIAAARGCNSSPLSYEISAPAAGGGMSQAPAPDGNGLVVVKADNTAKPAVSSQPAAWSGPVGMEMLTAKSGPGVGEVTLYWTDKESADNFHVMYGTGNGYQYGALNIGKTGWFKVGHLVPGATYSFTITPVRGNRALYTNDPVRIAAKAPAAAVQGISDEQVAQPAVDEPVLGVSDEQVIDPIDYQPSASEESAPPVGSAEVMGVSDVIDYQPSAMGESVNAQQTSYDEEPVQEEPVYTYEEYDPESEYRVGGTEEYQPAEDESTEYQYYEEASDY